MSWQSVNPYVGGIIGLAIIFGVYTLVAGTPQFWRLATGADGRASTSKFQGLAWTIVVLFSYLTLLVARLHVGNLTALPSVPQNVLLALGFSLGTTVAAAGITVNRLAEGKEVKPPSGEGTAGPGALVKSDQGDLDLGKSQLLAWTVVALGAYLLSTAQVVGTTLASTDPSQLPGLPDIDATLMVLTGLGQAAYLGNKLVGSTVPRITSIAPATGPAGTPVILGGAGFGDSQGGSVITVDGVHLEVPATWADGQISFTLSPPADADWKAGVHKVGVIVAGHPSANTVAFNLS